MNFHFLHTLTGIALFISMILKVIIHYYLNYLNGRNLGLNSFLIMPTQYLIPFRENVSIENLTLKYLCNSFLVITCISLILNIIFGILIYN
jgi:hypothetical protein